MIKKILDLIKEFFEEMEDVETVLFVLRAHNGHYLFNGLYVISYIEPRNVSEIMKSLSDENKEILRRYLDIDETKNIMILKPGVMLR